MVVGIDPVHRTLLELKCSHRLLRINCLGLVVKGLWNGANFVFFAMASLTVCRGCEGNMKVALSVVKKTYSN